MPIDVPPDHAAGEAGHIDAHDTINAGLATLSGFMDDMQAKLGVRIAVSDTEPASPTDQMIWFDTSGAT